MARDVAADLGDVDPGRPLRTVDQDEVDAMALLVEDPLPRAGASRGRSADHLEVPPHDRPPLERIAQRALLRRDDRAPQCDRTLGGVVGGRRPVGRVLDGGIVAPADGHDDGDDEQDHAEPGHDDPGDRDDHLHGR